MKENIKIKLSKIFWTNTNQLKFVLYILIIGLLIVGLYPLPNTKYKSSLFNNNILVKNVSMLEHVSLRAPFVYDFNTLIKDNIKSRVEEVFNRHADLYYKMESEKSEFVLLDEKFDLRKKMFSEELKIDVSNKEYKFIIKHKFDKCIPKTINSVIDQILSNGVVSDKKALLQEAYKGIILRIYNSFPSKQKDINDIYDLEEAKKAVSTISNLSFKKLNSELLTLVINFSQRLIEPNVIFNVEETVKRKDLIIKPIIPKFYYVKSSDGTRLKNCANLNKPHFIRLKIFNDMFMSIISQSMILILLLLTYYEVQLKPKLASKKLGNKDLVFLTLILLITIVITRILAIFPNILYFDSIADTKHFYNTNFGLPVAAGSMIVCMVTGIEITFPFAFLSALIVSMSLPNKFEHFIYFFLSSVIAVWWIRDCRERSSIIKVGGKLGLFCVMLSTMINIHILQSLHWIYLFFDAVIAFAGGMSAGMIVIGVLPLVEMLFNYTTNSTLLELANPDRSILRKLMLEAPGTYHHSIVVGTMVEAAASEIGANSLLGKVCGYYHDIGKLKQPLYFVENQLDHRNKHDKLSPSMSSLVIISHVKYGVEIAKKHNLGDGIIDVINQHHGNSLISYFFDKAKQIRGEDSVNISDFRYPGPLPQTVEAGLVMLADVVEAASRTLVNPTPSRVRGLVNNLINKVFSDGQLSNCDLTLKDLNNIAKSFNNILNGIYHNRVEYKNSLHGITDGKIKDADINKKQSEISNTNANNLQSSPNSLKRLGLS